MLATRIFERDLHILRKVWLHGWAISSLLMPVLFLTAMGVGLGGVVDDNQSSVDGLSYLRFVTPGLLVAAAMQQAAGDSMWPVVGGVKWDRRYHAMMATPLGSADVQTAALWWIAFRATVSGSVFALVGWALDGWASPWAVLVVPAAVLTALAFGSLLSAFAITQESDQVISLVYRLGIMPVFLFSGAFFPVDQLPAWLERLAWLSPLWHGVDLARHAGTGELQSIDGAHVVVLVGVIGAGAAWGRRTFARRLAA